MELKDFIPVVLDRMNQALMTAVDGLSHDELTWRPGPEANSIGFILWHQVRVEDIFVQRIIQQQPQVWETGKWHQKLNLPENPRDTGVGYTAEQAAAFPVPEPKDLLGYAEAVRSRTLEYLRAMPSDRFDEKIQTRFWGETTVGNILSLLLCEISQHIGQIAYLRGLKRGFNK